MANDSELILLGLILGTGVLLGYIVLTGNCQPGSSPKKPGDGEGLNRIRIGRGKYSRTAREG